MDEVRRSRNRPDGTPASWSGRVARAWERHPAKAFFVSRQRLAFYSQLHALLKAGIALPVAFADLAKATPGEARQASVRRLADDIARGSTLADAVRGQPGLFDDTTVELIAAAERSGTLEQMLQQRVAQLEEVTKLAWRMVFLAIYPAYLLGGILFVGPLLSLPGALRAGAPRSSLGWVYLSSFLSTLETAVLGLGGPFCFPLVIAALGLDPSWDRLRLRLPVLRSLFRNLYAARFSMTLGRALGAGIEVNRSFRLAISAMRSPGLAGREEKALATLRGGASLFDAVSTVGVLEPTSMGQLAIAERTGKLDEALERLSREHWTAVTRAVRATMYLVLALLVAVLMVSITAKMLGVLLGTIYDHYQLPGLIERS